MTPFGVQQILTALDVNQCELAWKLGVDPRTVRYWCSKGAPPHASIVLTLLHTNKISWVEATRMVRERRRSG